MKDTKKNVLLAVLTSLAIVLSLIDKVVTPMVFPFLPTAKIGFANVIVVLVLYTYNFKETLTLVTIKILIANLLFGGITSFIIGGSASITSFLSMYAIYIVFKDKVSAIGISAVGGFVHVMVQLFVSKFYYGINDAIMYYGSLLIVVSLVSGVIIGFIGNKLITYLKI